MRFLLMFSLIFILSGCVSSDGKAQIRSMHAKAYVLNKRNHGHQPLTNAEKDAFIDATAKDWESIDKMINGWKPTESIQSIPLN